MQSKEPCDFKKWHNDKSKSRRCDHCQTDEAVKVNINKGKVEREALADLTSTAPVLVGLSKTEQAAKACDVRDRLADIKQSKEDKLFCGDL
jgi:hypothetical protein